MWMVGWCFKEVVDRRLYHTWVKPYAQQENTQIKKLTNNHSNFFLLHPSILSDSTTGVMNCICCHLTEFMVPHTYTHSQIQTRVYLYTVYNMHTGAQDVGKQRLKHQTSHFHHGRVGAVPEQHTAGRLASFRYICLFSFCLFVFNLSLYTLIN